jgi:integrase/recombinase XerD
MTTFTSPVSAGSVVVSADPLRLAMSAYLARFKGISREHTCSDLNVFFTWCAGRGVEPLAAQRTDLELFVRWMQETRRFKPSTVARRTSGSTEPASSTVCLIIHQPSTCAGRSYRRSHLPWA